MQQQQRPTLKELRLTYPNVTAQQIADAAHLSVTIVDFIESGGYATERDACKTVDAFNALTGNSHTLDDIQVRICLPFVSSPSPPSSRPQSSHSRSSIPSPIHLRRHRS